MIPWASYMHSSLSLIWAFNLGVLIQSFSMLKAVSSFKETLIITSLILLISLLTFLPGKQETTANYDLTSHSIVFISAYIFLYSSFNKKKILPSINERTLLVMNIVFLYYLYTHFTNPLTSVTELGEFINPVIKLTGFIIAIASAAVLINGLLPFKAQKWIKICFYGWYLAMAGFLLAIIIIPQIYHINMGDGFPANPLLTLFSLGMISLCCCVDILNVLSLIPVKGKHQTFKEALNDVKEQMKLFNNKYQDDQLKPTKTISLIALIIAVLLFNYFFLHLNDGLIVNIIYLINRYIK